MMNLTHNKIVRETMSERFRECLDTVLLPKLEAVTDGMTSLLMYEDYIADDFQRDGRWYYPFVVTDRAGERIIFVSWSYDKRRFASSPYAYVGAADIDFEIEAIPPEDIEALVYDRARTAKPGSVKLSVTTTAPDVLMLAGKYSQSFVDEMARQLAGAIEAAVKVEGISDSPVELELVFGSGTYMEHTAGKVTYRRLLMVDGASRPRDFWVKWYSVTSDRAYSLSDHIGTGEVVFEVAEDVSQKIREKEYRFLCSANPNKYQAAMGKRNVTEWRDIIKRLLRRGELTRTVSELEYIETEETLEVELQADDELDRELRRVAASNDSSATEEVELNEDYDDISMLLQRMLATSEDTLAANGEDNTATDEENSLTDDDGTISFNLGEGLSLDSEIFEDYEPKAPEEESESYDGIVNSESDEPLVIDEPTAFADVTLDESDNDPITFTGDTESATDEAIIEPRQPASVDDVLSADEPAIPESEPADSDDEEWEEVIAPSTTVDDTAVVESDCEVTEEKNIIDEIDAIMEDMFEKPEEPDEEEVVASEEIKIREDSEDYARRLREEARREFAEREARLREEYERREAELRQENERLEELARHHEERHDEVARAHQQYLESARQEAQRRENEAREKIERDRIAEAARQSVEEERARMTETVRPTNAPVVPEFMAKRVKIIFRAPIDYSVFGKIKETIESTVISLGKASVEILMRASIEGDRIINLNITKMPSDEEELLISIVKAIGNSRIGVTKIIIEDL